MHIVTGMTNEDIAGGRSRTPLHIDVASWGAPDRQSHPTHPLFLTLHSYGADEHEFDEAMGIIAPHNDYVALRAPIALPSDGGAIGAGAGESAGEGAGAGEGAADAARAHHADAPSNPDHPGNVIAEGMVVPDVAPSGESDAPEGYGWFATMMPEGDELDQAALDAALAVDDWVAENVPAERPVVPIGFSQGAAVALHLLRVHPERYRAAVSLSGFHAPGDAPADDRLAACDVAVFHGYGRKDTVVPRFELIATAAWLDEHTYLTTKSYPGLGHALNLSEITDLCNWLTAHDIITGVM